MNIEQFWAVVSNSLPSIIAAIGILLLGFIVALVLRAVTRTLLEKLNVDRRVNSQLEEGTRFDITDIVSKVVFWLTIVFAVVAALNYLDLGNVATPLDNILQDTVGYIPNLLGGIALAFLAFVLATIARRVIQALFSATDYDERLARSANISQGSVSLGDTIGNIAFYFILLLFLPIILDTLALTGLLAPVNNMIDDVLGFLPNLISAAVIFVVGYFVARIIRDIVVNLLQSTGVDQFGERMGLSAGSASRSTATPVASESTPVTTSADPNRVNTAVLKSNKDDSQPMTLSRLIGLVIYALILIPVAIAALDALNLEAISAPATAMLNEVLNAIPNIFAAAVLLAIAYFVGRFISELVTRLLAGFGVDRFATNLGLSNVSGSRDLSSIIGTVIFVGIMLFAATEAANLMGFEDLAALMAELLVFFGQVILGLIVIALGLYFANLADSTIRGSDMQNSALLATVARWAIIILAGTMGLRQMGIADDIITLAFGLLLGAAAVAAAIAFGLGGREIAARELRQMVSKVKNETDDPTA